MKIYQIFYIISFSLVTLAACQRQPKDGNQKAQAISVKGSDTVLPITQKEAEEYMKVNKSAAISVVGGGSGTGITALMDGTTDICMASRAIKLDEKLQLEEKGIVFKELTIGYDALSVVVNPANPVEKLTRQEVERIFMGYVQNWKEVGGPDWPIVVYSRESSSGTYEFFKEHVMGKKNYSTTVLNMPATGAIVQSVSQTKGAIGYIGLAYLNKYTKPIALSYDDGKTYVAPSIEAASDGSYPVSRPLYYYFDIKNEAKFKPFIDYILSEAGQKNVLEAGFVPLKLNQSTVE